MVKNSKFFRTFGPPCRNPLAKVDGSTPECAQGDAKENRNGRRLSCYRRKPQKWYYVTHFLAHPVEPRDRWVQTHRIGERYSFFSYAVYMPLFLILSEIYGRKVSKWWKNRFFKLFDPPCKNALADLDGSTPERAQVCVLRIEAHLATLRKTEMVAVLCTNETTPSNVLSF